MIPTTPRGGLLGGSSSNAKKPSKLAALAAARKKKQEAASSAASTPEVNQSTESEGAVALLDRLSFGGKPNSRTASAPISVVPKPVEKKFPIRKLEPSPPFKQPKEGTRLESPAAANPSPTISSPSLNLRSDPSDFAAVLCGPDPASPEQQRLEEPNLPVTFTLPYTTVTGYADTWNVFLGPSPDDVVSEAQSKGKGTIATSTSRLL